MDITQSADISTNTTTEDVVNELQRIGFSPVVIKAIEDNEVDGISIRHLTDGDITLMLPGKVGPARKLSMLIDCLKKKDGSPSAVQATDQIDDGQAQPDIGAAVEPPKDPEETASHVSNKKTTTTGAKHGPEDVNKYLPKFSAVIQRLLNSGDILVEWDKFVEETSYFVLSVGGFESRGIYSDFGRILYQKYPCIGFSSGSQPWSHFLKKLSQKVRNIRWRWSKRGEKRQMEDSASTSMRKKAPRRFMEIENQDENDNDLTGDPLQIMDSELMKPKSDQDKALILKAQRFSLASRRKFIQTLDDANMKEIIEKYPILKVAEFVEKEFFLLNSTMRRAVLSDRWPMMLTKLDGIFQINHSEDTDETGDKELLDLIRKVESAVKFVSKTSGKRDSELIVEMDVTCVDLESRNKSPPRLVVVREGRRINSVYVVGDGIHIHGGGDLKFGLQLLLYTYYVFDLSYPKCYQLLGFLQTALLQENSPFFKGSNYLKFEKRFLEFDKD